MREREFKVWDPFNSERGEAVEIEARSPIAAAEWYAKDDVDGHTDGLYSTEHPIAVEASDGDVFVYLVGWVDHAKSWQERLSEGATIRALRLVDAHERDIYLRGDIPREPTEAA